MDVIVQESLKEDHYLEKKYVVIESFQYRNNYLSGTIDGHHHILKD